MSTGGRVIPGGRRNEIEEDEMNGIANVIETEGIESVGRDQEVQVLDERTVITYLSVNQPLLKRTPMRKRKASKYREIDAFFSFMKYQINCLQDITASTIVY